jgi:NAD(P)-dependent dehydrogenase (short-subunit alcohol dehydrogenase family)
MGILNRFSLGRKVALVTGATGIAGRQMARALAEAGAACIMASRNRAALEAYRDELSGEGLPVYAEAFDQANESSILGLRDRIVESHGRIDILVNNAVARPMKGGFGDDSDRFAESMQINATGLFLITRAMGDVMAAQQRGSIINIASIQGMAGTDPELYQGTDMHGWYPDYYFHKGGMINFTRFVASYYGRSGVRCNCISPGGIETDNQPPAFKERYAARTFLGRLVNDTDLMGAIVFFASDASAYVTGTNLPVDGGYTAK